jgi:hypothetical protein
MVELMIVVVVASHAYDDFVMEVVVVRRMMVT